MTSLTDAMQVGFDKTTLANETDAALLILQTKAAKAIEGWDNLGRAFIDCEIAWYNDLNALFDFISTLLTARYGCND